MSTECRHGIDESWCSICNGSDDGSQSRDGRYGYYGGETKQDLLNELCDLLGVPREPIGEGSSLPSGVFEAAARRAGLRMSSMPQVGRDISRLAGLPWGPECDSTGSLSGGGSTVTAVGLRTLIDALGRI